eukprot:CAMPEP_0181095034 /NCGR_PEP_ID=MMETSP1071-20121207/10310_1 /TAXON_ID=35127 /ORGANISM="Thalassiosira sp., Strain NH16" /LENGTH=141 /DNA_ID=CAMNT_0023177401 /DNA_START=12 /DNA_END=438 /DNA_ORIENTATION=+
MTNENTNPDIIIESAIVETDRIESRQESKVLHTSHGNDNEKRVLSSSPIPIDGDDDEQPEARADPCRGGRTGKEINGAACRRNEAERHRPLAITCCRHTSFAPFSFGRPPPPPKNPIAARGHDSKPNPSSANVNVVAMKHI